jgi:predicted PurR-regulated permease PerM
MEARPADDLARTTFQLLALGILIVSTFWIVRPFLIALSWAAMIAIATWPLLLQLQARLGGRRAFAVAVMTTMLLLVLVVPLYFGVRAIVENTEQIVGWSRSLATMTVPQPPGWVEAIPVIGTRLAARWRQLAELAPEDLFTRVSPYVQSLALWFVQQVGGVGLLLFQFLLTVLITAILYVKGEAAAQEVGRFARRLAGTQGENAVYLAAQAIRGVALAVVGTAILQTTLTGLGLLIAGVPFATILTAVVFMLCVAQIGPTLVLIPVVIWMYSQSGALWGTLFLVYAIFCGMVDNVVRPILIRRGADLPLLLIFTGVIGGLIAFGVIGLFIGPVVLAVAYTLLADWVSAGDAGEGPRPAAPEA